MCLRPPQWLLLSLKSMPMNGLQSTAVVEGEIFSKSLAIEEHAAFEGVSRRLERAVEAPSDAQAAPEKPVAQVVAISDALASA